MSKHTPGPWRYWACKVDSRANPPMYDYAQFANPNGHVFRAPLRYMREEDARLIAAAPDLLEALVMVRDADEDCKRDGLPTIPPAARAKIDAAIAKAEKP
jgi:hypothetical protein